MGCDLLFTGSGTLDDSDRHDWLCRWETIWQTKVTINIQVAVPSLSQLPVN